MQFSLWKVGKHITEMKRATDERVSTEHFTDALAVVHNFTDTSEASKANRAAAEDYLMTLKNSVDGLNLAFHILSNEDFQEIRCFWAFNTVIHHFPNIAVNMSNDQASDVYATLFSWIHRCCCTPGVPILPEFIVNKHAQMMVAGMQEFFPTRWGDFFNDVFSFLEMKDQQGDQQHADQIAMYFLRIFQVIDERVVNKNAERNKEQRDRDMLIKDAMRETVVERLVGAWFFILCEYRDSNADIARVCLDIVQTYIDWIDVQLMMEDDWINLFYFFMTVPNLRQGGCECLLGIVTKKQLPPVKFATLHGMRLLDAMPDIAAMVTAGEPTTGEEEGFMLDVVLLAKSVMSELLQCAEQGGIADAAAMLHAMYPQVSPLLRIRHFQVRDIVLPWITNFVKSNVISEDEARDILDILYSQTMLPEHELIQPSDETIEQRKQLHNCIRLVFRRQSDMVMEHCAYVLGQVTQSETGRDARELPCEIVEAAARYLYELGEAIKMEWLRNSDYPYSQMVHTLLHSTVSAHPNAIVHLAYFELFERVSQYFQYFRDEIVPLLQQLIFEPCGITNPQPKVRSRICYLFSRLTQALKKEFAVHSATIVTGLMGILGDPASPLVQQDKMDVYETLGMILSVADLNTLANVAEDTVSSLQTACENPSEQGAFVVAECISFLGSMAKGIGGIDSARMPDSPPLNGQQGGGSFPPAANLPSSVGSSSGGGNSVGGVGGDDKSPVAQVFHQVTQCVLFALEVYSSSWVVREKAMHFMHQIINILGIDAMGFIADICPKLLSSTNVVELPRILRLIQQFVNKTRGNASELLGEQLFPMAVEQVTNLCNFDELQSVMGVFSESVKEQIEAVKAYLMLVHTIVHSSAIVCLDCSSCQDAVPTLMRQLTWALQTSVETELPTKTLQIYARLANSWCTADQQDAPPGALESYLMQEALPLTLELFTTPHQVMDLKDGKNFLMIAEFCQLLKTLVARLGERGLYAIYGILTSSHPMGMSNNDAFAFCARLRDEPRASMQLKNSFRVALEEAQQRNIQAAFGSTSSNVVVQQ